MIVEINKRAKQKKKGEVKNCIAIIYVYNE